MAILKQIKIQTPVKRTNRIVLFPLQSKEPQLRSNGKPVFKDGSFLMLTNVNEFSDERVNLSFACCGHCDDLKQEVKRLNAEVNSLKDFVYQHNDNSTMKMQLNRLQCDNSSLVKTI